MSHPFRNYDFSSKAFDSFSHDYTDPLPVNDPRVEEAIQLLEEVDIDGETMEYIITRLMMRDQMRKQLMGTCNWLHVHEYFEERLEENKKVASTDNV